MVAGPPKRIDPAGWRDISRRACRVSRSRGTSSLSPSSRAQNVMVQKFQLRERGIGAGTWDRAAGTAPAKPDSAADPRAVPKP